jgi:hypothetical protein
MDHLGMPYQKRYQTSCLTMVNLSMGLSMFLYGRFNSRVDALRSLKNNPYLIFVIRVHAPIVERLGSMRMKRFI